MLRLRQMAEQLTIIVVENDRQRALERIRAADVVFYDSRVDAEVLALIPERTEMVNVGK